MQRKESSHLRVYEPDECGKDGYPLAWHSIDGGPGVKHMVREAAGFRCVRCHHPYRNGEHGNGEHSPCDEQCTHGGESTWRILTVHHLRLGDDAKRDLRWWNLAALCQRCHLQIQGKVQMERIWPWPHSEWFKPYVAGWYAWTYLGEDISREYAEAHMDHLLSLESVA